MWKGDKKMNKSKDKVLIELLIAILTGINILVIKQSKVATIKEDNEFTRYVKATTKMAKEYLEDE